MAAKRAPDAAGTRSATSPRIPFLTAGVSQPRLTCRQRDEPAYPMNGRGSAHGERGQTGDCLVQHLIALAERETHEGPRRVLVIAEHRHRHADHTT
jgi:hypothetical protein